MDWDFTVDADTLREEQFICGLSKTEKEIYFVRRDYLNGKCDRDTYEDAVDQLLFYAEEDGIITAEESRRLWKKYLG